MSHLEIPSQTPYGYVDLAVGGTAVALPTPPTNDGGGIAQTAFIQVQKATVRARFDGGSPTASVGVQLAQGQILSLVGPETIAAARFISDGGQAVTLSLTWFG